MKEGGCRAEKGYLYRCRGDTASVHGAHALPNRPTGAYPLIYPFILNRNNKKGSSNIWLKLQIMLYNEEELKKVQTSAVQQFTVVQHQQAKVTVLPQGLSSKRRNNNSNDFNNNDVFGISNKRSHTHLGSVLHVLLCALWKSHGNEM